MATPHADLLLQEYVVCDGASRAEALLETLVVEHASPSIQEIVRDKLTFLGPMEAEDVRPR
jgi:hypothetical protein